MKRNKPNGRIKCSISGLPGCIGAEQCNLSKDLRFDELRKVLESCGYEINAPRSGSSHYTFRKQGVYANYNTEARIDQESVCRNRQIVESEAKNDEDAE